MGVQTRVVLFAPNRDDARRAAVQAFERIAALEQTLSDYRPTSELSRLSDAAGSGFVPISPDLFRTLELAQRVSAASDGAFDVTIGPASAAWREWRRSGTPPDDNAVAQTRALVGWRGLELDGTRHAARLARAGMRLDPGGIGKGLAAQDAVDTLIASGHPQCLVALAGDVAVGDAPPGTDGWAIDVLGDQSPSGPPPHRLLLTRCGISTSGDTAQALTSGTRRASHTIDPRTCLGIDARRSVTVVAPRAELADALATALVIVGPEGAANVLESFDGAAALFECADGPGGTVIRRAVRPDRRPDLGAGAAPR